MQLLFGIIFHADIDASDSSASAIGRAGTGVESDATVSDGKKLAQYVTVRPEVLRRWRS